MPSTPPSPLALPFLACFDFSLTVATDARLDRVIVRGRLSRRCTTPVRLSTVHTSPVPQERWTADVVTDRRAIAVRGVCRGARRGQDGEGKEEGYLPPSPRPPVLDLCRCWLDAGGTGAYVVVGSRSTVRDPLLARRPNLRKAATTVRTYVRSPLGLGSSYRTLGEAKEECGRWEAPNDDRCGARTELRGPSIYRLRYSGSLVVHGSWMQPKRKKHVVDP